MKNYINKLLFLVLIIFISCDPKDPTGPNHNNDLTESIEQEITKEYAGNDVEFNFDNKVKISIKSSDNKGAPNGEITIKQIKNENYFNTENDVTFDFSTILSDYVFDIEYNLKPNLVKEDIVIFKYSPENSKIKLDAEIISFNYDNSTGVITAKVSGLGKSFLEKGIKLQKKNHSRLTISYSDREKLAESDEQIILELPYYAQPGGSCWAACAQMIAKAYSKDNDEYSGRLGIIDFVKYLGHSTLNDGVGLWAFKTKLPPAIKLYSTTSAEVSTFVSSTNMLSEIISKLKEKKPIIMNLLYPDQGTHCVVILGYKKELISAAKIQIKLLIHNPQNVGSEAMYQWANWDWLMKDKWPQMAYQLLYPETPLPSPSLVTLGMPIEDQLGELHFRVKTPSNPNNPGYKIRLKYSKEEKNGYCWHINNTKCDEMPDSTSMLEYKLPIYNASKNSTQVKLKIKLINTKTGKALVKDIKTINCKVGNDFITGYLDLDTLLFDEVLDCGVLFELIDDNTLKYLDGFYLEFKLKRSKIELLDCFFIDCLRIINEGVDKDGDGIDDEENIELIISDFPLKKSSLTYSGNRTSHYKGMWGDSIQADEKIKISLDNSQKPTKFTEIEVEALYRNVLSNGDYGNYRKEYKIKLEDVPMIRIRPDILEAKWWGIKGTDVCQYITLLEYNKYNKFRCTSSSSLSIRFK